MLEMAESSKNRAENSRAQRAKWGKPAVPMEQRSVPRTRVKGGRGESVTMGALGGGGGGGQVGAGGGEG